jgi:dTDP-glucose 4,6-dehydratase
MKKTRWPVPEDDLVEILNDSLADTEYLRNSQIAVLGGSGFIGTWIVSFLDFANDALNLNIEVIVPTRDEILAKRKLMITQNSIIKLLNVDYCETNQMNYQDSKFLIIGATPTNKFTGSHDDSKNKLATKNSVSSVIKFAQKVDWIPNVINLSSGAIYGEQVNTHQPEKDLEQNSLILNEYSFSKINAERELQKSHSRGEMNCSNPRLFAFFGPHLPLDAHFAIGNFLNDCIKGKYISMKGNPETVRSYLYPSDLITWIIKLLIKPSKENLNFGSDIPITMNELAQLFKSKFNNIEINMVNKNTKRSIYVPAINNTKRVLGVTQKVSLEVGIDKWINWLKVSKV